MQRELFQIITVGHWIAGLVLAVVGSVFWLATGVAVAGVGFSVCRHLAGGPWFITAGIVLLLELLLVTPHLMRALQGFLFPGFINQAHGRARVATLRDVQKAKIWQA